MAKGLVLMVEGTDDEHVVKNICGVRKLGMIDNIVSYGGKDPLLDALGVRLKESEVRCLGVLLDADEDATARWQAVAHRLIEAGYEDVPQAPVHGGAIVLAPGEALLPKVGVWLMPDNAQAGILEDFLAHLVPAGDNLLPIAKQTVDQLPQPNRFPALRKSKAVAHTWLAWQEEPGRPFGQAIMARYLDATSPSADEFAEWLSATFFA